MSRKTNTYNVYKDPFDTTEIEKSKIFITPEPEEKIRLENLDLARGLAILGMFLSHTVKGHLSYAQMPYWGIVPVHLITKFSSSLFIIVFGISLSLFFIPFVDTEVWGKKRNKLLFRSVEIMFWYKVLTIFQMFQTYSRERVVDALLFKSFPDFVEVLGFYSFCLLWIPFFLPMWAKINFIAKGCLIILFFTGGYYLNIYSDFWGYTSLKAILVEEKGYFTYGQLQRGAMVLFGLLLGDIFRNQKDAVKGQVLLFILTFAGAILCATYFYFTAGDNIDKIFYSIARNYGKHPPSILFLSFSLSIALAILSICMIGFNFLPMVFKPITIIGQNSFFAFNFHIIMIFVVYRYLFDLRAKITYETSIVLTLTLILLAFLACVWINRKKYF